MSVSSPPRHVWLCADDYGISISVNKAIREFINEKLDKKALIRLHDLYPKSFPGDLAAIRLIELYTGRGEDHLAERQIQRFLAQFPDHPYGPKATDTLAQQRTVALLL